MPYSKLSEVPKNLRKIDGVPLNINQINKIVEIAESIENKPENQRWAIAISQFKKTHEIVKTNKGKMWVRKKNIMAETMKKIAKREK